ncbi:hypothetical protein LEP1GSC020_1066 [Leptospira interrogans serovar Grippotyphosa str. 2006006986]|uniref:Uncharacterized protein n=3 Tax=Leptospira interrogans TaxID=173 RepID=A0A0E2D5P0_LEPIR|nr:hypothetical protein G436_3977 [Leptospira interrogans serovar Hardjo str. Norma]EJO80419.1 hypothetical protein LEP1GSC045_0101 [Leptospira interrogans serovar Pomona str. Kennewicki LC82-25]EKN97130.1 hypothetical protein LEP1GSC014_3892 [Leptospira interrogans serovar Pomona str. Pomona]EKO68390.1 hypothetical protein LEP1GSC069_3856 [Leptospira interrogans serovar Canicola str. Fiocruz LV133]EKO88143.1 hypothetical protein LEP1GSC009_4787 [Leptospira interrogans serovar Grippotyphosa str
MIRVGKFPHLFLWKNQFFIKRILTPNSLYFKSKTIDL